jgi:hypothetical protein
MYHVFITTLQLIKNMFKFRLELLELGLKIYNHLMPLLQKSILRDPHFDNCFFLKNVANFFKDVSKLPNI